MKSLKNSVLFSWVIVVIVFVLHFLYFAVLNRYHLGYQEQIQLFRFDLDYFFDLLIKPGGIAEYIGSFLIQFYLSAPAGAMIVTFVSIGTFFLCRLILKRLGFKSTLWPIVPVCLVVILQSDYVYYVSYTLGFLLALTFFLLYMSLKNNYIRFAVSVTGTVLLYVMAGEFAIITLVLIILYELFYFNYKLRTLFVALLIVLTFTAVYTLFHSIYLLQLNYLWLKPLLVYGNFYTKYSLYLLFAFLPFLLFFKRILDKRVSNKPYRNIKMSPKSFIISLLLLFLFIFLIIKYVYDYKTELLLGIDSNVQKGNWDRALKISSKTPEINQIAIYLTNIALYKSGRLGDEMFHYNQIGPAGLFLEWGGEASPFFGNEVFYQLGYINEAYRWAFEAMIAKGPSPRLLKKLVLTSIINGEYKIAEKYLGLLKHTFFYRKWANYYLQCINDCQKLNADEEINEKRHYLIHSDFFADVNNYEAELIRLLENHPVNRMAFEYLMSSFLLKKDLISFTKNIHKIKELKYKEIPVHYEEALLIIMSSGTTNVIPAGYSIRESTKRMFENYLKTYTSFLGDYGKLQQLLFNKFGKSYLFYYQFR